MRTDVAEETPTRLAFEILNGVFVSMFTTNAYVFDVLTIIAVPFVVLVPLLNTFTVS